MLTFLHDPNKYKTTQNKKLTKNTVKSFLGTSVEIALNRRANSGCFCSP